MISLNDTGRRQPLNLNLNHLGSHSLPLGVRQWLQASSQLRTGDQWHHLTINELKLKSTSSSFYHTGDAKATPGLPGGRCGVPKTRGVAGLQRGLFQLCLLFSCLHPMKDPDSLQTVFFPLRT